MIVHQQLQKNYLTIVITKFLQIKSCQYLI